MTKTNKEKPEEFYSAKEQWELDNLENYQKGLKSFEELHEIIAKLLYEIKRKQIIFKYDHYLSETQLLHHLQSEMIAKLGELKYHLSMITCPPTPQV